MSTRKINTRLLLAVAAAGAGLAQAADDSEFGFADAAPTAPAVGLYGSITAKAAAYDYTDGPGSDYTHFLQRYDYPSDMLGDSDAGGYLDADLDLASWDGERNVFTVERVGNGMYNQLGTAAFNSANVGITGGYSRIRTATGGIAYQYNPNMIPGGTDPSYFPPGSSNSNSGYIAQFNDDTGGKSTFSADRLSYSLGLQLKPHLFGGIGSASVDYEGYTRQGDYLSTYVLGGGDVRQAGTNAQTAGRVLQRWRGFDQEVDEKLDRLRWNLSLAPGELFNFAYDGTHDRFRNHGETWTHADIDLPPQWQYNTGGDATRPLGFTPDSNLWQHDLRLSKTQGRVAAALGYSTSTLEQDTFTAPQQRLGYDKGEIETENAFANLNYRLSADFGIEGYYKYYNRDNDSTFPVPTLIDTTPSETLGVRINNIESNIFGIEGNLRVRPMNSTVSLGWKTTDRDRDLTFNATGITQQVSFYRETTEIDEVYLKWVSRPAKGLNLRVTPSYVSADKTGLVAEPDESFALNVKASYLMPSGLLLSGHYDLKPQENDNNSVTDKVAPLTSYEQEIDDTAQSAGLTLSYSPSEDTNFFANLGWTQKEFEARYLASNRRRFESTAIFELRDNVEYDMDTWDLSFGGDWKPVDNTRFTAQYGVSLADGQTASGLAGQELPQEDGDVDYLLHSVSVGFERDLSESVMLGGTYAFDYYDDSSYDDLSGGRHGIVFSVTFEL